MKLSFLFIVFFCIVLQALPQKYVKVWSDEFNKAGLPDSTKWDFLNQKGYNDEVEYYTKRESKNAWIQDTTLIIELRKEPYLTASYTSAMLVSKYKGDWLYGKFEIRAKVPGGSGSWPAIWMMPTGDEYGGWPYSGEIDIMEYIGVNPNNLYFTTHYQGTNGTNHQSSGTYTAAISQPYNKFVTFTLVWTPTKMEWYADNKLYHSYSKTSDDQKVWPFNKMFYMILNLAYGGWGGALDDTKLPKRFNVDYVRVYQLQESAGPFSLNIEPANGGTVEVSPKMDTYPEGTKVTVTAIPDAKYDFDKWLHVGSANPLSIEVAKDMTLIPIFKRKNELILNGDFTLGLLNWNHLYFQNSTTMAASPSVVDGVYVMNVTKPGTANWHICDQQGDVSLEKGATYLITFDAKADNPGTMDVYLAKNHDDYGYYYSTVKTITGSMQHFSWTIKMLQESDPKCRFGFGFGRFTGKVYLDNVSIEKQVIAGLDQFGESDQPFELFPNPASDYLDITNRSGKTMQPTFQLYNLQGQVISTLWENQAVAPGQQIRLNLKECNAANGIYLLYISTPKKSFTRKLIINQL
ncbi:MAG TPA: family 16 glycosylhydrolase [Prolixibacteraceae bacterium]|jgi:beta-glucanase (GH16 family)